MNLSIPDPAETAMPSPPAIPAAEPASAGFSRDQSRACMVADTLAWAVAHRIPLDSALRSLPFFFHTWPFGRRWQRFLVWLKACCVPFRPFFWISNLRWSFNVRRIIDDLNRGAPLSAALERHLGRHFPGFFFLAMAHAERNGCLDTALPLLAFQLRFPATVASDRRLQFAAGLVKVAFALWALAFTSMVVLPRFQYLLGDLDVPSAAWESWFWIHRAWLGSSVVALCFLVLTAFSICHIEGFGEYVLLRLPFVGRDYHCFLLGDFARGMAAFLRQGQDIVTAAKWNLEATRSHWLRPRLEHFTQALDRGTPWIEAWSALGPHRPLDSWIIRNAAAREDPAGGFELLAQWLHQEIQMNTRRLDRWIDPVLTLAVSVVVALVAVNTFSMILRVVHSCL